MTHTRDSFPSHSVPAVSAAPAVVWLLLVVTIGCASAAEQGSSVPAAPPITYVDLPKGIELADYAVAWPRLEPCVNRLREGQRDGAKAQLKQLAGAPGVSDGVLNLLAQLDREDGELDVAERLIEKAIASNPRQHRHYFQQAMISFSRLTRASGLGKWIWQQRTRDAYQRAFDLDPAPVPYRYYLVYSLLETPAFAGGDKEKALRLADQGVRIGQKEFYVVRADVSRARGEYELAFADYDSAMAAGVFKLTSFLAAVSLAMEQKDWSRAEHYSRWAVQCRPNSSRAREALGDYEAIVGSRTAAVAAYEAALRIDPKLESARIKLAKLAVRPLTPRKP